ncbi:MAG: di-trans,poly-cis-decaprenylcistransferase [Candidatus Fraserbacteria bacterium RBG_16_55_9]|uniref:Isoprenyl transferase n=1 Tax=Fraserbacteria sp. (strain RBG_16_55_9) TaxID=1817864 RepID=A0A1F5UQI7_FRAXR|nr:MAG: di-trans,poly-cis-decaprenylcistransferase [Candidatus Fraserbacteria bacterium RBG_16_55_9]
MSARLSDVRQRELPRHIAIIMDGNGRWAKLRGQSRMSGHHQGMEAAERIVRFVGEDLGIKYLTLYAFSTENWNRPPEEVQYLMDLIREFLDEKLKMLLENEVRLRVLGDADGVPAPIRAEIERAMKLTESNQRFHLNIAFNYGGRQEILRAVQQIVHDRLNGDLNGDPIDEALFRRYLYTADQPDPDLLIRTSGEERISNFLLWQIAYAEFWVTKTLWPDFKPEELLDAIEAYQCRQRKFGAVVEP